MNGSGLLSERQIAASLLILCFVVFTVGGILYTGRAIWKWPVGETPAYLRWERGFVIAAVLVTVLGLVLLEGMLRDAGDSVVARLGMMTYVFGAVVVVVAETTYLSTREFVYPQIVVYIILAFLAQTAFGVSLLRTGLAAGYPARRGPRWPGLIDHAVANFLLSRRRGFRSADRLRQKCAAGGQRAVGKAHRANGSADEHGGDVSTKCR